MSHPTVPRLWPNSVIVCLATGPSLTQEDCDFVRGKARVIAINDAHRLAPWADVLFSSDRRWWPVHKGVPSFIGRKYGLGSMIGKRNPFVGYPDITVLRNSGHSGLELDPGGLCHGLNSGYAAINLAVHFGASRIVLLGYDMRVRGDQVHFFGKHQGMNNPTDSHFGTYRRQFKTLVEPLRESGVEVINCTPNSSLEAFPMADLRDVFAREEAVA